MARRKSKNTEKLKVMMLGGLYEIGKNLAVIEYGDEMMIVDCGLGFPEEDMPGIDLVIPDITYLEKNYEKITGIVLTHGHEDHIGALPYVLKQISPPVYGTPLTIGILEKKLSEHTFDIIPELITVNAGDTVKLGTSFSVEFINVNHSIADAVCLAIKTPLGTIIHSGDFKIDLTPIESKMINLTRLGQLGDEGVLLLMCESTNAERQGYTPSERKVGASLDNIFFRHADKRITIATFSSNVHRVQQIINAAEKYGRKVAITGRSMVNVVNVAIRLGYMHAAEGILIDISEIKKYKPEQLTIVSTGSQGEPMSALYRMAFSEHDKVELNEKDVVIISANAIPGNEKFVNKIINELFKKGVTVLHDAVADVHVSGHACREELKTMHALTKPKYFMPIHGEYRHLASHKELAMQMGEKEENIFLADIGKVLEIDEDGARFNGTVPSGKVLVDGYGVGDVGSIVLRDRRHLAEDGIIVVVTTLHMDEQLVMAGPDIVSRGFVYVRESEELMDDLKELSLAVIETCFDNGISDFAQIKNKIKDELSKYIYQKTKRRPMILPIIMSL
ncbi:MAG: ribonuclease J [Clostridia bacterium]|nr:ribonuclease J [Clostridia bacterium]